MGKDKNIICTTEQLEEFLQQRNDIILDELKSILQQSSKNTDSKISLLRSEVEGALKMREKELRRLRRETEESFRTCERLLHALTFQRKMLEAVLKIRDREIQNLRRCIAIQKRLIVKTLNVVVADGVLEMTAKQRGELLKLVQEMADIDIHSSEGVGFSEESVLQEYREAIIRSERNANTTNIDNVIQSRREEKNALMDAKVNVPQPLGSVFTRRVTTEMNSSDTDDEYIPLDLKPMVQPPGVQSGQIRDLPAKKPPHKNKPIGPPVFSDVGDKGDQKVPKEVLFECGKLLGSAWVSFAISSRIGFTLDDVSVLRKRYQTDEERAKAMLLIWLEQSGEGSYTNLCRALDDIGKKDIAMKVVEMKNSHTC